MRLWRITALASILATAAGVAPAGAVLSGENGRIVFISGREAGDATARPYLLPVPENNAAIGTPSPPLAPAGGQYRHPSWSPDRTKIVYANGTGGVFDLFVQDLAAGTGPVPITNTGDDLSADRPAWSPDGTRIAYEHQPAVASTDRNIRIQTALDLTLPISPPPNDFAASGTFEGKPAWSPDSATLYYHKGDPNTAGDADIVKRPLAGGMETLAVADSGISEFQPSISPDGTRICFTLSNMGFNDTAEVLVAPLTSPPTGGVTVSKSNSVGDYNCTWSPDGLMIAYVNGTFSSGHLVMVRADNTSLNPLALAQDPGSDNFDGNPDWAPDGRPDCPDSTVTTAQDTPVTITVTCTDTGPAYEQSAVFESAFTQPTKGTLTQDVAGEPFTYTPNAGASGTDSFKVRSFDTFGFGPDLATVTVNIQAPPTPSPTPTAGPSASPTATPTASPTPSPEPTPRCGGRTATIVGTSGGDRLRGTRGSDVIAALGGDDRIAGRRGNDVVCAGAGRDRVRGMAGNDRLRGGSGRDRLNGGKGSDRCAGGPGRDRVVRCEP